MGKKNEHQLPPIWNPIEGNRPINWQPTNKKGCGCGPSCKCGTSGSNSCRCSVNLPDFVTIEGLISEEGTITSGSGFTVQHTSLGVYTVRFTEPFSMVQQNGLTIEVDFFLSGESNNHFGIGPGNNVEVVQFSRTGFRYFTFVIEGNEIVQTDLPINFSITGLK